MIREDDMCAERAVEVGESEIELVRMYVQGSRAGLVVIRQL